MPFFTTVIACACAVLLICARAAQAQTSNNDGYGLAPIPAPTMPVTQGTLGAPGAQPFVQRYSSQSGYTPAPVQAAPTQQAPQGYGAGYPPPGYAPPGYGPQGYGGYPQTVPVQQPYPQAPPPGYGYPQAQPVMNEQVQATVAAPMKAPQGYVPPPQPYGYVAKPSMQGPGYAAPQYGTQMAAADPNAYYAANNNGQNVATGYLLGPGDKVRVSVFGEDDLTGEYQIDGSGMIRLPLVGTLRAAGYTAPALENAIAGTLASGYLKSPRVNVEIATYRPFYIIGAVNRPGEYPYVSNMSVLNAIAVGGGFTEQAKSSVVYVRHEGSTVEEAMPANQLTRIWPGDVVRVKTTLFWDAMSIFTPIAPAAFAAAAIR